MESLRLGELVRDAQDARRMRSRDVNEPDLLRAVPFYFIFGVVSTGVVLSTLSPRVVEWLHLSSVSLVLIRSVGVLVCLANAVSGGLVCLASVVSALSAQNRGDDILRSVEAISAVGFSDSLNFPECPPEVSEEVGSWWGLHSNDLTYAFRWVIAQSYPFGRCEVGRLPRELVIQNFMERSDNCRAYLAKLLLFTQSERYNIWQRENPGLFDRMQLVQVAQELEMAVAHFACKLKRDGYTFEAHSLDEFFHPKKVCDMAKLIESDPGQALGLWQEFRDTPEGYYYLKLRESTELIQQFQQLPGQLGTKSARKQSRSLSTLGPA